VEQIHVWFVSTDVGQLQQRVQLERDCVASVTTLQKHTRHRNNFNRHSLNK